MDYHDDDIKESAKRNKIKDKGQVNKLLGMGEKPYNAIDAVDAFIMRIREAMERNKLRQHKSRLSNNKKKEILKKSK